MKKGALVVFEGIDGSGKNTQATMLRERLERSSYSAEVIHFPCYSDTFFGAEVARYLNGEYGRMEEVPAKFAAMLYAGDRFEKREYLKRQLMSGNTLICDRYVPSNIAHHSAKLATDQQTAFDDWVEALEYGVFQLPQPDLVIFLDMDPANANNLVLRKGQRDYTNRQQDLHEEDPYYLNRVYEKYVKLATERGFVRITCYDPQGVKSESEIADAVYQAVLPTVSSCSKE